MDAKNLNRSKHHKKKKGNKSSKANGPPEVFVLPPDLLQKLGINLGNVSNGPVKVKENADNGKSVSSPQKRNILGEESILTTASLMKKSISLMLSPTFVPTTSNMIPGEMEIACVVQNSNELIPKLAPQLELSSAVVTTRVDDSQCDSKINELAGINKVVKTSKHLVFEKVRVTETELKSVETNCNNTLSCDDTVKASDGKLSDIGYPDESNKKSSKINIISEERIAPSKVKRIKTLLPNISDLTPVTKDTLISKVNTNDDPDVSKTGKDVEGQGIVESNKLLNGSYYTEAIIVMDSISEKNSNLNAYIDVCDKNTLIDIPMNLETPYIHNFMNGDNIGSLENHYTKNDFDTVQKPVGSCNGIYEKNTLEFSEKRHENQVKNCDLDESLVTDCNIISTDEITEAILDVFDMSVDEFSDHDADAENNVVKFCNIIDTNENCVENNCLLERLTPNEEGFKEPNSTVYDETITIKKPNTQHSNETDSNANNKLCNNTNNKTNEHGIKHQEINKLMNTNGHEITPYLNSPDSLKSVLDTQKCNSIVDRKHDKESMDGNHNAIQSKLCIQGVEKPGGIIDIDDIEFKSKYKVLKSYQRKSKQKRLPIINTGKNDSCKIYCAAEEDINYSPISKTVNMKEYCVCNDFGRLYYYDSDHTYEHIHFWQHDNVTSDLSALFSIYYDSNEVLENDFNDYITDLKETEEPEYSICWNNFKCGSRSDSDSEQQSQSLGSIEKETDLKNTVTKEISLKDITKASITIRNDNAKHSTNQIDSINSLNKIIVSTNETQKRSQNGHVNEKNINAVPKTPLMSNGTNDKLGLEGGKGSENGKTDTVQEKSKGTIISKITRGVSKSKALLHKENRSNSDVINGHTGTVVNGSIKKCTNKEEPVIVYNNIRKCKKEFMPCNGEVLNQKKAALEVKKNFDIVVTSEHFNSTNDTIIEHRAKNVENQHVELSKANSITTSLSLAKTIENQDITVKNSLGQKIVTDKLNVTSQMGLEPLHMPRRKDVLVYKGKKQIKSVAETVVTIGDSHTDDTKTKLNTNGDTKAYAKSKMVNKEDDKKDERQTVNQSDPKNLGHQETEAIKPHQNVELTPKVFKTGNINNEDNNDDEDMRDIGRHIDNSDPANAEHQRTEVSQNIVEAISKASNNIFRKVCTEVTENDMKDEGKKIVSSCSPDSQEEPGVSLSCQNVEASGKSPKKNSTPVTNEDNESDMKGEGKTVGEHESKTRNLQNPVAVQLHPNFEASKRNSRKLNNEDNEKDEVKNVGKAEPAKQKPEAMQPKQNNETVFKASERNRRKVNNEDGGNDTNEEGSKTGQSEPTKLEHQKPEAIQPHQEAEATAKSSKKNSRKSKRKSSVLESSSPCMDEPDRKKKIKCGVCNVLVTENKWENHIISQHQFIAWKAGETFNIDDDDLRNKLQQTLKITSYLKCTFCNQEIRCLKKFLSHVKSCLDRVQNSSPIVCGVCKTVVLMLNWHDHIGKHHNYLAWMDSENPVDLQDTTAVRQHLHRVLKDYGDLICYKCGRALKRPHAFLSHIETCTGNGDWLENASFNTDLDRTTQSEGSENTETWPLAKSERVTCAICSQEVLSSLWIDHIATKHNYLAWQVDSQPLDLDNLDDVRNHLLKISRERDGLTCGNCGLVRKRAMVYLTHIKTCIGNQVQPDNPADGKNVDTSVLDDSVKHEDTVVTCAVCKHSMKTKEWITHISSEHNYMAWQEGSTPLDITNDMDVRIYLTTIGKDNGGLVCGKCGLNSKYAKSYLDHIKENCQDTLNESNLNISCASTSYRSAMNSSVNKLLDTSLWDLSKIDTDTVKCGVCANEVDKDLWLEHIGQQHYYRAWIDGQQEPDFEDHEYLHKYLTCIARLINGLKCSKCGLVRKYPKAYLQHVVSCSGVGMVEITETVSGQLECGVCHKKVDRAKWSTHAMEVHYNVAWFVGENPIDLNSPYEVEVYIKRYQQRYKNLVCRNCGITRVSRVGFYAHVIVCGKSEQEREKFLKDCDICKKKFLIIYTNQHMTAHRETLLARERKQKALEEAEKKKALLEEEVLSDLGNTRRKAAEKANDVIQKYKDDSKKDSCHCSKCDFTTEVQSELDKHVCEPASDTDESVKMEQLSDNESVDTDVDSNVSEEETKVTSKRPSDLSAANRVQRIPFPIKAPRSYLKESGKQFVATHMSTEDLFLEWRICEYVSLSVDDEAKYVPTLQDSCHMKISPTDGWSTYKRFEAKKQKYMALMNYVMFTGGCIQSVAWVPVRSDHDSTETNFLTVLTHHGPDLPRLGWEQTSDGPGLIQIWNLGDFTSEPEFVLGLAHDYGTVWGMSWCPSGARDKFDDQESGNSPRLGLLAVACSNGGAYIFCVPYPPGDKEKRCLKLKPVAELKISMGTNRTNYQATAVKWSSQKGHNLVVVGYSDGSVAYFDLSTESPILKVVEGNITVLYPYYDERLLKNCVEDLDIYPAVDSQLAVVTGASIAGSSAVRRPGLAGTMSSQMAVSQSMFQPHWPSTMLCGDEAMCSTAVNEMEWWGGGRRFGGARVAGGCSRCGRIVAATLPLLRLVRAPPFYPDAHKLIIGVIQMTPLSGKVKKKRNDDISMLVEPTTYDDAIKKYGIQYDIIVNKGKTMQRTLSGKQRPPFPERFPLADVTSLAFCPSLSHHDRLAVGVHGGFVFITSV